jgi:murein DD-endopeptidase MepM/ murein hydrolase activator NlpD
MAARALVSGLALVSLLVPQPAAPENPGEAIILSPYRSYTGANNRPRLRRHAGVDFGGALGAPILAAADGIVTRIIEWPFGCGLGVLLEHPGFKRWTAYCHMQSVTVREGQSVTRGEQIGRMGMSGNAMNIPHVHLELCTHACTSHADGQLSGTEDPLRVADGCFDPHRTYPPERLVLTFPVACLYWAREKS